MEDFDRHPELELPAVPHKGRGAVGNVDHRYTSASRIAEDDGWTREEDDAPPHPAVCRQREDHPQP